MSRNEVLDVNIVEDEESTLRPSSFDEYVGQTDLKENSHNQYIAVADIVTPKNDPMVTTPFSDMATGVYSTDDYVLATATTENYTEYTDVVGKVTLNLEKVEDRFVITSWDITLDD